MDASLDSGMAGGKITSVPYKGKETPLLLPQLLMKFL